MLAPLAARAQAPPPQTGTPPFAYTDHLPGVSVFSGNGNVSVSIQIASVPGRGLGFTYRMLYNSNIYKQDGSFVPVPDFEGGWQVGPGYGALKYDELSEKERYDGGWCLWDEDVNFRYYDAGGTEHVFPGTFSLPGVAVYPAKGNCRAGTTSLNVVTNDGSGDWLDWTNTGVETVTDRDGDVINFAPSNGGAVVEDTNGNYISMAEPNSTETNWTGTAGEIVGEEVDKTSGCTNPVNGQSAPYCQDIEVPSPGGGFATYVIVYADVSASTGSCGGIAGWSGTLQVPVALVLPEYTSGSSWYYQFSYGGAGRLTKIRYPTGGITTFSYGSMCTFGDGTVASVSVAEDPGGVTTYTRNSGTETTITRPDGSKTVITYDASGLPTDVQNYDTDGATLLSETKYTNTGGTPDFPATATNFLNGTQISEQETSFDSLGDLTERTQIDDLNGDAERVTSIQYFAPDRPSNITISDGSTTEAETAITYDDYSSPSGLVNPSTALANHDASYSTSYTARDNPTEISRTVSGSATLDTYFVYDTGGNVVSTVEPNGHAVAATYNQCGGTFANSIAVPGGTETLSNDCYTGLLASRTGPNGHETSYGYDADARLTSVADPDSGGKTIGYPAPSEIELQTKISSAPLAKTQYLLADGYGRPAFRQIAADGANCNTVATEYGSMGRVSAVSQPYSSACGGTLTAGAVFTATTYDGLGRPTTVTNAESAETQYQYSAGAAEITGPSPHGVQHILQEDGFGDLWKVCEVTSLGGGGCGLAISGSGFLTTYSYNALGKLTSVVQGAETRSFGYDELGRRTSETTPESGTTTFTYGSDSACGGSYPGSLAAKQDAVGNVICYSWDAWGRVTAMSYPSSDPYAGVTPAKTFVYGSATVDGVAMPNALGRLAEAYTGAAGAKITDEGFGYGSMGRPTDLYEMTPGSGGYYHTGETYWLDGERATLSVPGVPLITYNPNALGEVASVSAASGQSPAPNQGSNPGATYDAAGQMTGITYGSGDSDSYTYDAATGEMTAYSLAINGQTDAGSLTWNPDGTLKTLDITDAFDAGDTQNCNFTQDDLGRLNEAHCGSEWLQNFTTDQYGDVAVTGANNNDPFAASFANGRISSFGSFVPQYDADGNLEDNPLTQTRGVYKWDADGRPIYVDGDSQTFDALDRLVYNGQSQLEVAWSPGGRKIAVMNGQSLSFALIPLPGGAGANYGPSGLSYYAHPDWQGSWRLDSSPSRTETGDLAYSPYGATYAGSGPVDFTGHWIDTPGNFDDSPHRLLAPMMDRWLSPDPAGLAAVNPADPQSWNAYGYVGNQPLEFTDPLGLFKSNPCPSPWMCLDPAFWQFEFGLQGAAELEQIVSGGGTGPARKAPIATVPITGTIQLQGPACVSAAQINSFLAGSPLAGQGQNFYQAGQQYNVNPALPVAIADAESSLGRNVNATWGFHNAWGWGNTPALHALARAWGTWQQGISHVTWQLSNGNYLAGGLATAAAIYGRWCQSGNCAGGLATINGVLAGFGVSPSSLRFQACQGEKP